jgi:hypothetical protein
MNVFGMNFGVHLPFLLMLISVTYFEFQHCWNRISVQIYCPCAEDWGEHQQKTDDTNWDHNEVLFIQNIICNCDLFYYLHVYKSDLIWFIIVRIFTNFITSFWLTTCIQHLYHKLWIYSKHKHYKLVYGL